MQWRCKTMCANSITTTSIGLRHCHKFFKDTENPADAVCLFVLSFPLRQQRTQWDLSFSHWSLLFWPQKSPKLLQVYVLCRLKHAFNLATKTLGIIITVLWCQPEAVAGINVPLCEVLEKPFWKDAFSKFVYHDGAGKKKYPQPPSFYLCLKFGNTFHSLSLCKLGGSLSWDWGTVNTNQKVGVPGGLWCHCLYPPEWWISPS